MSPSVLSLGAATSLFLAAMIHAAVTDLQRRRILNWTVLALVLGYLPLALGAGLNPPVMVTSLVAAVLVFFIGFAGFCAGWIGGGDVKLAAAATLWLGAGLVVPFLLLATVFGALLCVLLLGLNRWQARTPEAAAGGLEEIPYGPGIVLAALALFGKSQWFAGL